MTDASPSYDRIHRYISAGWDRLLRSMNDCATFEDAKTRGKPVAYLPAELPFPSDWRRLQQRCGIRVERLPARITALGQADLARIPGPGLLYLPNPYVVPGGQFNEMYGWDSYFIILGLLRDNRRDVARGMVDNFLFEIEHYGGVLNANRTYYLTRSQPPFLTSMILAVHEADQAAGQSDSAWLRKAYGFAARDYEQWVRPPHLAGDTGLSRFFDLGAGPVPEIKTDPSHYYREAVNYFLVHGGANGDELVAVDQDHPSRPVIGPLFDVFVCDPGTGWQPGGDCEVEDKVALTADFYKGDRSMRESGFDVTFRFGPFGAHTHHYAAVDLNCLLYKTEIDLQRISLLLGNEADVEKWRERAAERKKRINQRLWNKDRGLYFDYDFLKHEQSGYEFATTFYPLWAGLASEEQARALAQRLGDFEHPGGLVISRNDSGAQWDYPYGWAPVELLACEGLRRYGYQADAGRVAYHFLTMVLQNFERDKTIREKYNVVTRSSEVKIEEGYTQNVVGFGWTNGVFLELERELPPDLLAKLKAD
ncbi:MAG TPA: trehalase family glycosidase [Candidatus Acidoferrales bacterium]|nr:trehalase family glycosidase [Candidatus Acidoferrales bacterium]